MHKSKCARALARMVIIKCILCLADPFNNWNRLNGMRDACANRQTYSSTMRYDDDWAAIVPAVHKTINDKFIIYDIRTILLLAH